MLQWIKGSKEVIVNKSQEISVLNELQVYIIMIGLAVAFMLILIFLWIMICCDKNIGNMIKGIFNDFFWNGYIRFIDITFLPFAMAVGNQIRLTL
jgi:hypothetical protein